MRGSNKKSKSRQLFEEVFDQQTRRFSAFDLLGLSADHTELSTSLLEEKAKKEIYASDEKDSNKIVPSDHALILRTQSQALELGPDYKELFPNKVKYLDGQSDISGSDSLTHVHGSDWTNKQNWATNVTDDNVVLPSSSIHGEDRLTNVLVPDRNKIEISKSTDVNQDTLLQPTASDLTSRQDAMSLVENSNIEEQDPDWEMNGETISTQEFDNSNSYTPLTSLPQEQDVGPVNLPHLAKVNKTSDKQRTDSSLSKQKLREDASVHDIVQTDKESKGNLDTSGISLHSKDEVNEREGNLSQLRSDGLVLDQTVEGLGSQTPDRVSLGTTVWDNLGHTQARNNISRLRTDRQALEERETRLGPSILLAPVQWNVWQTLLEIEATSTITSYREIAKLTKSSIDGVRKAIRVLEREGGIIGKETVRSTQFQGFRFKLDRSLLFHKGTINQAKAILKRGLKLGQTPDRTALMLGPDRLRMFVCQNINIKQTDIVTLLRITPPTWTIREQTLTQIAEFLPEMTAIEFRFSLAYLVDQAKTARQPIRNHNAWVKAAFEKNGGPLITERDIEARFTGTETKKHQDNNESPIPEVATSQEVRLLRFYLMCSPEERISIDRLAEQKAAPLLKIVAAEHRNGVLEEARAEAVREYFRDKQ